ncbi:hypothetical protein Gohar_022176 [Gossypium harknessii]|uniref:Uncharacterized protein n=1 Tax=Gossypium harknessii TaxID=34285 RepID=A0A7J9IBP3_9ROSI|nr:hypothetical protein [Gossypium harknessii]
MATAANPEGMSCIYCNMNFVVSAPDLLCHS